MRGSIVIPAHNEEQLLPVCLAALAGQPGIAGLEIVVVVNGSSDRSAAVAREAAATLPSLVVLETPVPGKANALNLGDAQATLFPRIYLDADIELSPGTVGHLITALDTDQPRVASPAIRFDTADSDALVRHYYAVYRRLPYVASGLIGLGIYAVSEAGRRRFDTFPDLMADDLFVQRLFAPEERLTVAGEFLVRAPRRWRDLVAVRTRAARGAQELADAPPIEGMDAETTSNASSRALVDLVRQDPRIAPSALAYVGITLAARLASRRSPTRWHRDESSRQHP